MGNRAVITTKEEKIGIYLHNNGGRDSIEPFLEYCKIKGYRAPDQDCYGWARLCQVIGNFFGGSTSIGIDTVDRLDCDNYDNGTYIIEGWEIVRRKYNRGEQNSHDRMDMLKAINEAQPTSEQLPDEYFTAVDTVTSEIKVGDKVLYQDFTGKYEILDVVGIGGHMMIDGQLRSRLNGQCVVGVPYTDKYEKDNINAYLKADSYRVVK